MLEQRISNIFTPAVDELLEDFTKGHEWYDYNLIHGNHEALYFG